MPDPYYGDDDDFERCLDMIEAGCRGLVVHLAEQAGPTPLTGEPGAADGRAR